VGFVALANEAKTLIIISASVAYNIVHFESKRQTLFDISHSLFQTKDHTNLEYFFSVKFIGILSCRVFDIWHPIALRMHFPQHQRFHDLLPFLPETSSSDLKGHVLTRMVFWFSSRSSSNLYNIVYFEPKK
ncbi:hypothetical protein IGI04_027228, partial [Brassica rapa subsp. trilocularis]